MKSIYETTNGTTMGFVSHSEEYYLVQLIGNVSKPHYQGVFQAVLEDVEMNNYPNLILNIKDLRTNPDFGRTWLTTQFIPKFYKQANGLKMAIVNPSNVLERKSIPLLYGLIKSLGIAIHVKFFEKLTDAHQWVIQNDDNEDFMDEEDDYEDFEETEKKTQLIQLTKKGDKRILKIGGSRFKFKVELDPKGRLEAKNPLENLLPNVKIASDAIKDYFRGFRLFQK